MGSAGGRHPLPGPVPPNPLQDRGAGEEGGARGSKGVSTVGGAREPPLERRGLDPSRVIVCRPDSLSIHHPASPIGGGAALLGTLP